MNWYDFNLYGDPATSLIVTPPVPPEITSYAPPSPVNDTICTWRTFNVTVNQTVNVSWYLNETSLFTNDSVTEASCTLHANVTGVHNVTAIVSNANGTDRQTWIWNVTPSAPSKIIYPDFTDTDTPGSWRTWIGVMNTGDASTTLNLTIYNQDGSLAYSNPDFVTLEPKAAHFFRPGITAGIAQGSTIVSGDNLAGTCHESKNDGDGAKVYTAVRNAAQTLYYPDFTDTDTIGNWRTWMGVVNAGDTSTTVRLDVYNPDGSLAYTNANFVTLEPKASHFFRPGITAGIAQGCVVVSGANLAGTCHVNKNGGEGTKVYTAVTGESAAMATEALDLAYDPAERNVNRARYAALARAPATAELTPSEPITFPARLSTNELIYDDGEANKAFAWNSGCNRFAVRFTPLSYPVDLKTARICLRPNWPDGDHEMFTVEVYDDDGPGGRPGTLLGGPVSYTASDWGWNNVDISGLGITIDSGDFYIAYHQLTDYPDCEGLCTDTDEPLYERSWDWNGSWTLWPENNYMIRCVVDLAVTGGVLYYPDFTDTDTIGNWRTWLGVMNTGDASTTLNLTIYNPDGSLAYSNANFVTLEPKATHFFRPGITAGIAQGDVVVSGDNLAGTCHVNKNGGEGTKAYTALSSGSSTLYYPDFTDTDIPGNWRTWMGVMNTGATSTTVRLDVYNADGSLAYSNANFVTLEPKAAHFFRPGVTAGIAQGDVVVSGDNLAGTCHVNKNGGVGTKVYTAIGV
jgi:predicted secreted protein